METKMNMKRGLFLALFLTQTILTYSQVYQDSLKKDDEDIISSIAPYPPDVRDAILNVSQYPQKIVKIERIQSRTSQQFQDLIANYSRDEQLELYELSRYPDLVHELVTGPPKTLEQVKPTLANYPKQVVDAVSNLYPMHLADLQSMDKTYQSSQSALHSITEGLPSDAQADFKKIVAMPEVMNLLTERIDLVVSLGEAYKADPSGIKHKLDDLSAKINEQNQKDLADYKSKVASDPKMQDEMKKSAEEFADSYSANGDSTLSQQSQQKQTVVNNNYYYSTNYTPNPYPYWFGYPYWYSYPMWYPRPLYYYTGFYYGAGGGLVVVGLPSRIYSGWFFNYGYRRYPRYYGYCNNYYAAHRTFINNTNVYRGFNTTVNNHFSRISNNRINREVNVNRNSHRGRTFNSGNGNINQVRPSTPRVNSGMNRNQFRNSINQPNNFNHQSYSNFHSNQFHQQGWGNMRGGSSGGGHQGGGFNGGGHIGGGGGHGSGGHVGGGGHGRR
jgi:hypothetical protein